MRQSARVRNPLMMQRLVTGPIQAGNLPTIGVGRAVLAESGNPVVASGSLDATCG